ncbi:MAG: RNA-dependent RNA polymerase [Sanya tombus-like virus 3]|nr:MAG: RNA-dependent RNA polymerase [Sanya tombus-like virus 3]
MALTKRHLANGNPKFQAELWAAVARRTVKFFPTGIAKVSYQEVIDGYVGKKKSLYITALKRLKEHGLQKRDTRVRMFVKPDKISSDVVGEKAPRAIQYRSPEFNLEFARYIKPLEHAIYERVTWGNVSGRRAIMKGLNNKQRAQEMVDRADLFNNPVFIGADHSRFDSTIRQEHLKTTHKKYQRNYGSRHLNTLLRCQLNNIGYSKGGIIYRAKGTRMSGDYDTGLGNSVVNGDALYGFLTLSGIAKYEIMLDGDDSVIIIERTQLHQLNVEILEQLGFNTKLEVFHDIHDVEFCRSRVVLEPQPLLVRDPRRTIANVMVCLKTYRRDQYRDWLSAVGACELSCNPGVPVLSVMAQRLYEMSDKQLFDEDTLWKMGNLAVDRRTEITVPARLEFERAWGVDIPTQVALEEYIKTSIDVAFMQSVSIKHLKYSKASKEEFRSEYERAAFAFHESGACYQSLDESGGSCWWSSR